MHTSKKITITSLALRKRKRKRISILEIMKLLRDLICAHTTFPEENGLQNSLEITDELEDEPEELEVKLNIFNI